MWYLCSTRRLCQAAEDDHSNWNSGSDGGGDCHATTWERISCKTIGGIPSTGRGGRSTMGGSSTPTMGGPPHRVPLSAWASVADFPAVDAQMWLAVITGAGPWQRVVALEGTGHLEGRPVALSVGTKSDSGHGLWTMIGRPWLPSPAPTTASGGWGCAGGGGSRSPGSGHQGVTEGGFGVLTCVNSPNSESVRAIIWAAPRTPPCECRPSRLKTEGVEDCHGGALGSELYDSREGLPGRPTRRFDHRVS
jgi:hypothetical protein